MGPQHRQHQPLAPCSLKPRQHTRPKQRRFPRSRRPQKNQQQRPSLHPTGVEPLDHRPPVAVASEKHGRVFRLKDHQARKGGSAGIIRRWPGEAALILQRDALQLTPQLLQASLSVVAKVEPLQIRGDWFFSRRLVALDHLERRFA